LYIFLFPYTLIVLNTINLLLCMDKKYILFVAQECNFQSRIMFIPHLEFTRDCPKDYELLKNSSRKNIKLEDKGYMYSIGNLLLNNALSSGFTEQTEYSDLVSILVRYADGYPASRDCDHDWLLESRYLDCYCTHGFNHIKNYSELRDKYKPIDSFLVLGSKNGKIKKMSPYDTNAEMMKKIYGIEVPKEKPVINCTLVKRLPDTEDIY